MSIEDIAQRLEHTQFGASGITGKAFAAELRAEAQSSQSELELALRLLIQRWREKQDGNTLYGFDAYAQCAAELAAALGER